MRMTRETPIPQTERGRGREYVSVGLGFNLRLVFDCCHSIYRIDIEREKKSHQFFISIVHNLMNTIFCAWFGILCESF